MESACRPQVSVREVTDLAQQEGWDTRGTFVLCESALAADMGLGDEGCRWEGRRLIGQCIAASRGYTASVRWSARATAPDGTVRLHRYLRFQYPVATKGFDEVCRPILLSLIPLSRRPGELPRYVISYADTGALADAAAAVTEASEVEDVPCGAKSAQ
jgi:hypothetical protein